MQNKKMAFPQRYTFYQLSEDNTPKAAFSADATPTDRGTLKLDAASVEAFRSGGCFEIQDFVYTPLFYGGKLRLVDHESETIGDGCTAWEEFLDMKRDSETNGASAVLEWADEAFEVPSGALLVTPAVGSDIKEEVLVPVPGGSPVPNSVVHVKIPSLVGFIAV